MSKNFDNVSLKEGAVLNITFSSNKPNTIEKSFYSKVLCNEYKTIRGYKSALTRYENEMKEELAHIHNAILKGWKRYLGESIYSQLHEIENELINIKVERRKIVK